jgi:hypothetical protein
MSDRFLDGEAGRTSTPSRLAVVGEIDVSF